MTQATQTKKTTIEDKEKRLSQLRQLCAQHIANKQKLQEQASIYGEGERPLRLLNQIEAEEKAIEYIQSEIERLEAD